MPFVKIRVHAIWGTKSLEPVLGQNIRPILFQHIKEFSWQSEFPVDSINGYFDHIHCLFTLNKDLSIAKTISLLKKDSVSWANRRKLMKTKLAWSDEYIALSVSEGMLNNELEYIKNQELYHQKVSFAQEYESLLKDNYFLP